MALLNSSVTISNDSEPACTAPGRLNGISSVEFSHHWFYWHLCFSYCDMSIPSVMYFLLWSVKNVLIGNYICVFSIVCDPAFLSLSTCRAAVYQWRAGSHWPWGPPDQRSHSHPLWRHHTGCTHQNTLQHTHLAGQCAECNRLVCVCMYGCVCLGADTLQSWIVFNCASLACLSCPGNPLSLVDLVPLLQKTLKDESSVTCKMACSAVRVRWIHLRVWLICVCVESYILCVCVFQHCIMTMCNSTLSELGLQLVINLLALRDLSYWLVRTELLETLAEMDFR